MKARVSQLINDNNNPAANQFVIFEGDGRITFQSYKTKIADITPKQVRLSFYNWHYSQTTAKHLYIFLRDFAHLNIHRKADVLRAEKEGKLVFTKRF